MSNTTNKEKTAENILRKNCINYGGIEYIDFHHALQAMQEFAALQLSAHCKLKVDGQNYEEVKSALTEFEKLVYEAHGELYPAAHCKDKEEWVSVEDSPYPLDAEIFTYNDKTERYDVAFMDGTGATWFTHWKLTTPPKIKSLE